MQLELAKADRRFILARQRLLRWVLLAQLEREHGREGCPAPDCGLCRKRRARVETLERRLSRVLLCTVHPALRLAGQRWACRLIVKPCKAPRGINAIRLPAARYLIDHGYVLQPTGDGKFYAWRDTRR